MPHTAKISTSRAPYTFNRTSRKVPTRPPPSLCLLEEGAGSSQHCQRSAAAGEAGVASRQNSNFIL